MCGIIGGYSECNIVENLITGLLRLEYRGYDSAGIAVAKTSSTLEKQVVVGRVGKLQLACKDMTGNIGLAHTRWATHGKPTLENAHPITAGKVTVVHNGIIENHTALRAILQAAKRSFTSDTDTEVIAHLLNIEISLGRSLKDAWRKVSKNLEGAYAVAAMTTDGSQILIARQGSPLLLGKGETGIFFASDAQALVGMADKIYYLHDGDYALIDANELSIFDAKDKDVTHHWHPLANNIEQTSLGEYRHYMQKEIFNQPDALAATIEPYIGEKLHFERFGDDLLTLLKEVRLINIIACGTSYHASMIARGWLESYAAPCNVEIASEYRYRHDPLVGLSLCIFISQSGETADTLAAMRVAKQGGATTLAIVNVESSTMAKEADHALFTKAGVEIGVASTKAFTAQLALLLLVCLAAAKGRHKLPREVEENMLLALQRLPHVVRKTLLLESQLKKWAKELATITSAIFIGRRAYHALALEGALKLKEISYIHAEGIAAGELKHGHLALIEEGYPVICLLPDDELTNKMAANLAEIQSRGGNLFVISAKGFTMDGVKIIEVPKNENALVAPIVYAVTLQLLAYHTARYKGTDIDKPRNLAKAVTVE